MLRKCVLLYKNNLDFSFSVHKFLTQKRKTRNKARRFEPERREKDMPELGLR